MNPFLTTTRLVLTPLSPIHIGADEDFEPTNYVIENKVLYGFNPVSATLSDGLRKQLGELGNQFDLLKIQQFFRTHSKHFTPHANILIPVAAGVADQYEKVIGKEVSREEGNKKVCNQLVTQRTIHNPLSGQPYIPGSSFKGALRTAWLDKINNGAGVKEKKCSDLETRLFEGDFANSPLRLLKIADLMPQGEVERKVIFAVNHKKHPVIIKETGELVKPKGIATRKETISPAQYRCFNAEAVLQDLGEHHGTPNAPKLRLKTLRELAQYCNRYYLPRLQNELEILTKRDFCHPDWAKKIQNLIKGELAAKLNTGEVFLIRLGRYGDAETKTLSGIAQIKILQGKNAETGKMNPAKYENQTKTVWLAAEHPNTCRLDMLPFGWALVEINPQQDLPELKAWCAAQVHPDMTAIRAQHAQARAKFALEKHQRIDAEKQKVAEAEAREQAEQVRLAALANMTDNQRAVTELAEAIEKLAAQLLGSKENLNGQIHTRAKKLVEAAKAAGNWTDTEKSALKNLLAEKLPLVVAGMKDPKDKKEQLKRLGLNDL